MSTYENGKKSQQCNVPHELILQSNGEQFTQLRLTVWFKRAFDKYYELDYFEL